MSLLSNKVVSPISIFVIIALMIICPGSNGQEPENADKDGIDFHTDLSWLTSDKLEDLDVTSPILRNAYAVTLGSGGVPGEKGAVQRFPALWMVAVYEDLERRGDSATPILFKIMAVSPDTYLEASMLRAASVIDTIELEPFLNHWRNLIRKRTNEINADIEIAMPVFADFGTDADIELIKWLAETRLDLAGAIHRSLNGRKQTLLKRGEPVTKSLMEWELDSNLGAASINWEQVDGKTSADLMSLVEESNREIANQMAAADPLPPPPAVEAPFAPKAPEKSNPRPPAEAEETTHAAVEGVGGTNFAVGFAVGMLALLAGVWFVLRRKST